MRSPTKSNAPRGSSFRWGGVADVAEQEAEAAADPWQGKELGDLGAPRLMPTYSVLKRLGPSEMYVGGNEDLANALRIAYEVLASPTTA